MSIRGLLARIFAAVRGSSGPDLSRGPLSDRIRDAAVAVLRAAGGGPVLEVGVGEGLLARDAIAGGSAGRFVGVDISCENLRRSRERIKRPKTFAVVCARGDLLPFKRSSFRTVVCINTLHNQASWAELETIVSAAGALVGRGGSLIIDIRNARDPLIGSVYRYSTVFDPSTRRLPVRAYRLGQIGRLLERQGFRIVRKVRVYYPFWFLPSAFVIEARR
jgi:ubiquinone/menaquinone biosynthesis C-methylase UbiE